MMTKISTSRAVGYNVFTKKVGYLIYGLVKPEVLKFYPTNRGLWLTKDHMYGTSLLEGAFPSLRALRKSEQALVATATEKIADDIDREVLSELLGETN
jgi:hypothetical protein